METYTFTLIVAGFTELTETVEDALYRSGCDDALLGIRDGVPFIEFERMAPSFEEGVLSAVADVERTPLGLQVLRVEPDELVTATEIAERTGRSRESVRLLASGARGPGGFPPPVSGIYRRTRLWRWTDVVRWLAQLEPEQSARREEARVIAAINGALELRRHEPTGAHRLLEALHV
jgi:hypothetical protein